MVCAGSEHVDKNQWLQRANRCPETRIASQRCLRARHPILPPAERPLLASLAGSRAQMWRPTPGLPAPSCVLVLQPAAAAMEAEARVAIAP